VLPLLEPSISSRTYGCAAVAGLPFCAVRSRAPPRRRPPWVPVPCHHPVHDLCRTSPVPSTRRSSGLAPASPSASIAPPRAAAHSELLSAPTAKTVSPPHRCPPLSLYASHRRRLAGDWPPPPPCAMTRALSPVFGSLAEKLSRVGLAKCGPSAQWEQKLLSFPGNFRVNQIQVQTV
jgi:hypothetical protein